MDQRVTESRSETEEFAENFVDALKSGFKSAAAFLIQGPNFDVDADDGRPLRTAIELGYLDIAQQLLDAGCNPNLGGRTAEMAMLTLALEHEYFELVDTMLQNGAEISIRNSAGWTPLIWASLKGRKKCVEFLLERGADLHICSDDGWNALTGAFFRRHSDIVEILRDKGAHFGPKYQEAALLSAYEFGDLDTVEWLIRDGCSVNIATPKGTPFLSMVCERGDQRVLDLALEAGADLNVRDKSGTPVLLKAIFSAQYEAALKIIEKGASVNVTGGNWSPLHIAADRGRAELCDALIKAGASINLLGKDATTALMLASTRRHDGTVELLLEHGADPYLEDSSGHTAFWRSYDRYNSIHKADAPTSITKILRSSGVNK